MSSSTRKRHAHEESGYDRMTTGPADVRGVLLAEGPTAKRARTDESTASEGASASAGASVTADAKASSAPPKQMSKLESLGRDTLRVIALCLDTRARASLAGAFRGSLEISKWANAQHERK